MRTRVQQCTFLISLVLILPICSGQTRRPDSDWTIPEAFIQHFSGEKAKAHVIELSRYYREDATPGFHEAALYVADAARKAGLQGVGIEAYPVDGKIRHFNMQSRFAWAPRRGELWLVNPPVKLADFAEASTHLATWSASADAEAELVDIGEGTQPSHYAGKEVRGKIVFTTSPPSAVQPEAVTKRGAMGIVSMWSPPSRAEFPDQVQWLDTGNNRQPVKTFGFVLSRRQGLRLRERMAAGPVRVRALVDATLGAGNLEVITGIIPGRDLAGEEILLLAHLCHFSPSSNDDASGCGLLLELARVWQDLISRGVLERPRRTIRFLWVPENYGTVAYAEAHPEISTRAKAALSLDMVGEDLDRCNSVFRAIRTPDSRPSFLNDLVEHFIGVVAARDVFAPTGSRARFRYAVDDYMGGSDHVWMNDAGVGVPAMLFMHWPDNFYHSNEDTPDKVDPSELKRVGLITFGSARFLGGAGGDAVERLAAIVAEGGRIRLAQETTRALTHVTDGTSSALGRTRLMTLVDRETRAIASTASLDASRHAAVESLSTIFKKEQQALLSAAMKRLPAPAMEPLFAEGGWVLKRQGRYLSSMWRNNLSDKLSPEETSSVVRFVNEMPNGDFSAFELFNLIDGQRTLREIVDVLDSENSSEYMFDEYFGKGSMQAPPPYRRPRVDRSRLVDFLQLALKAGVVTR